MRTFSCAVRCRRYRRAMLLARPVLIAVGLCVAAAGCRPQADRVARAAERAEPHLASFQRFERWARRAAAAESASRGPQALSELVFAPIRHAPDLVAAWVHFKGDRPLLLALPADARLPAAERWLALRDPELGALRVAASERCQIHGAAHASAAAWPACVLISRGERAADQPSMIVTMAFASKRR
jgi:hypothetical protein